MTIQVYASRVCFESLPLPMESCRPSIPMTPSLLQQGRMVRDQAASSKGTVNVASHPKVTKEVLGSGPAVIPGSWLSEAALHTNAALFLALLT